jgi:hypothetical protein
MQTPTHVRSVHTKTPPVHQDFELSGIVNIISRILINLLALPIAVEILDIMAVAHSAQARDGDVVLILAKIVMITIFVVPCMHVGDTIMNAEMLIVKPRIQDALLRDVLM